MSLPKIEFKDAASGLGRLPDGKDHISAIIMDMTSIPKWNNSLGKKYLSTEQAAADGITESSPVYGLLNYFISEYFRMTGPGELYVINSSDASYSANAIIALTENDLRQAYVYSETNYAGLSAKVTEVLALRAKMQAADAPCEFIVSVKDEATAVGVALPDVRTFNAPGVVILNSGDGSGKGLALATALGVKYIPGGGTMLGTIAAAKVSESIGWVAKFPLASPIEYTSAIFSDGSSTASKSAEILGDLHNKGYVFARKHNGISGTYWSSSNNAASPTADANSIELDRTLDKAKRVLRTAYLPDMLSPLFVDADGKLSPDTVQYFVNKGSRQMDILQNAGEISAYQIIIDPEQNLLNTKKLIIAVKIVPVGTADEILINIGYAVSL